MPNINIALLLQKQFGYVTKPFDAVKADKYTQTRGTSLLGTPFLSPTTLIIREKSGNTISIKLPNEPMVMVTGSKSIIKTEVNSYAVFAPSDNKNLPYIGTFKEITALNDYVVTISGICVQEEEESEDYPTDQVRQLNLLINAPFSLEVINPILSLFNIHKLVIESCSFPAAEGSPGLQPYQFVCYSDKDINLTF